MKFLSVEGESAMVFSAVGCAPGGRESHRVSLPVQRVICEGMPDGLDAILMTADLQYHDRRDVPIGDRVLMGHVVAKEMADLGEAGMFPDPKRTGVVLAGDFYSDASLAKRGGSGDVEEVWKTFAERFRWVVGVAGNHDLFAGSGDSFGNVFRAYLNAHPLHGERVSVDGIVFGGVSGIIGDPAKPWRTPTSDYGALIEVVCEEPVDVLVLHSGPQVKERGLRGDSYVAELLASPYLDVAPKNLVCGHTHWPEPLAELGQGTEVLNVDSRVALVVRA